ncbi:MAG: AraC family transcriptional regulator [Acidimicrobiia bacterium]|nr:AraC family transcriptional regulator [Acidimicrobiia bacterium]
MSVSLDQTSGDPTARVMDTLRLTGAVFSLADLTAPWGVASGEHDTGLFHAVISGSCWARPDGGDPVFLSAGQVVIFPQGHEHVMLDDRDSRVSPTWQHVPHQHGRLARLSIDGGGKATKLLCGTVHFDRSRVHPMLTSLPSMIVVGGDEDTNGPWISATVDMMRRELSLAQSGSSGVLGRLADVVVLYALRSVLAGEGVEIGWLEALRDPAIAEAVALIHERPSEPWTVGELASAVGMSRSAFYPRFTNALGEPPGTYLIRWRIHLAARLIAESDVTVAAAARQVGYADDAALGRAFRRWTGVTPSRYRALRRTEMENQ